VIKISELASHPHMRGRGTIRAIDDPKLGEVLLPGMPLRFSDFPHNPPLATAALGEHNTAVLRDVLGYDDARIAALTDAGVLYENPET
jgi:CoA:oxalate CoA-transferase